MKALSPSIKARAIATALGAVVGATPQVVDYGGYSVLQWAPEDRAKVQRWIETQLQREPGDVRIELAPIVAPLLTKRALPFLLGAMGIGFLLGRL